VCSSDLSEPVDVLAIASSTGGPNALAALFAKLPTPPVPVLMVQHMPPVFTRLLGSRLTAVAPFQVIEAEQGQVIEPGRALIAPGDFHMVVRRDGVRLRAALHQGAPRNSCRPAADELFESVAAVYGSRVLAVVLTGMGQDGLRGCEAIRAAGGQVIVQDEPSSVVWGMPGFVARAGLAHAVVPLSEMHVEIARRLDAGRARRAAGETRW
jgi:two-component system chemotaxis response regulator CheB